MKKELKFNTNIKCMGCVAQVTSELNELAGAEQWEVDITTPSKVLTVKSDTLDHADIIAAVAKAGFSAAPVVEPEPE